MQVRKGARKEGARGLGGEEGGARQEGARGWEDDGGMGMLGSGGQRPVKDRVVP